jgi:hypothetical protein
MIRIILRALLFMTLTVAAGAPSVSHAQQSTNVLAGECVPGSTLMSVASFRARRFRLASSVRDSCLRGDALPCFVMVLILSRKVEDLGSALWF